jgi:hypothetical protein
MHDIGKIGIPDAILLKPGKLDAAEWEVMYQHPIMGAEIIGKHDNELLETARIIALTHHEKWDGTGYPQGLKGDAIPLEGRIVAIADVFDALLSVRPYKPALSLETALQYIDEQSGHHFDPALVEAFRQALPEILRIKEIYADEKRRLDRPRIPHSGDLRPQGRSARLPKNHRQYGERPLIGGCRHVRPHLSLGRAPTGWRAADAVLITAGAGLGIDSGLPDFRGPAGFWGELIRPLAGPALPSSRSPTPLPSSATRNSPGVSTGTA